MATTMTTYCISRLNKNLNKKYFYTNDSQWEDSFVHAYFYDDLKSAEKELEFIFRFVIDKNETDDEFKIENISITLLGDELTEE